MPKKQTTMDKFLSNISVSSSKKIGKILEKDAQFKGGNFVDDVQDAVSNLYSHTFKGGSKNIETITSNVEKLQNIVGGSLASEHMMSLVGGNIEGFDKIYNKAIFHKINGGKIEYDWPGKNSIRGLPTNVSNKSTPVVESKINDQFEQYDSIIHDFGEYGKVSLGGRKNKRMNKK